MEGAVQKKENAFVRTWHWCKNAWNVLSAHKFTTLAGTLVFFLLTSLMPLFFWFTLLLGGDAGLTETVEKLMIFSWAENLFVFFKDNAAGATAGVSALFLLTTLWSSTGFFYHLRRSGEIIYDYRREKKGWKVRISAVLIAFALLLFLAAAGTGLYVALFFLRPFPKWVSLPVLYALVSALGFLVAWALNAYICPYRCKPRDVLLGSLFTAIGWLLASVFFSVYLRFASPEKLYGALSALIIFLLWLYWLMICFTAGVVYNSRRMERNRLEHKVL